MILRMPKVCEKTGLAKSTIYKKVSTNEFPRPISLGGNAVGWLESDLDNWIREKIQASVNDNQNNSH